MLIGYDRNEDANAAYVVDSGMSWPAVKIGERGSIKSLASKGETGFIPNIVMLKPDGTMVSNDRAEVLEKLESLANGG